jgi:GTP pyrophosphokinase
LAVAKHAGQKRLSGEEYLIHPLSVATILIEWKMDMDSIIAGVLHDTLEDTGLALNDIEQAFGKDIAFLVDGVTQVSKARSGMGDLSSYLPKTRDNLSKFLIALSRDLRVLLIKLADRLHNLRTIKYLPKDRQHKVAQESLDVFAPLADRLGMAWVKTEIEEISFRILKPKKHAELSHLLNQRVGQAQTYLDTVRKDVSTELGRQGISHEIDGRIKTTYSLFKKLKKNPIDEVYDLIAVRLIVSSKEDCYRVLGILHSLYQPMLQKIKDYISVPKPNGYQSLHTTVITPSGQIIEFQIRTTQMHEYAERGLAASFHYNEQKLNDSYIERRSTELPRNLLWILEMQEAAQRLSSGEASVGGLKLDLFDDRIFVYSPKGDIYDLPEDATVIDFAYAVHSDVGEHAQGAKINNKMAKLSSTLKNGDIVEVLTRNNVKPNSGWLKHVRTTKARQKIRAFLKHSDEN